MALNINGYSLSNNSGLVFGSSGTKLDTSGRLIVPNMPGFFGSKTGSAAEIRQYPWVINSTTLNINTCYNTSTGFFTCPVTGLYYTSWNGVTGGSGDASATVTGSGYIGLIKNGALQHYTHWNTNDRWDDQHLESILYCNAGDTIAWATHISPAPDNGSGKGVYGDNHNMSTIWLIG